MGAPKVAVTKKHALAALKRCSWNQVHAARELQMSRHTLVDWVREFRASGVAVPAWQRVPGVVGGNPEEQLKSERAKVRALEDRIARLQRLGPRQAPRPSARKREKEDRLIVAFPDLHGESQDRAAVAAFLGDLKRLQPDIVVGGGDLVDCDGFLAQHHTMGHVARTKYTYEEDLRAAGQFLDSVAECAPKAEIHLMQGNHDWRAEAWAVTASLRQSVDAEFLRRQVAPEEQLKFKDRGIRYYLRHQIYGDCRHEGTLKIGPLHFNHGKMQGGNKLETMLSDFGTNIVYFHTHILRALIRPSVHSGPIGAFNLGCLATLRPYYQHGDHRGHAHGYGIFRLSRQGFYHPQLVPIINGVSMLHV